MLQYSLDKYGSWCVADWNDRDQPGAQHADNISKVFNIDFWRSLGGNINRSWTMDLIIQDTDSGKCYLASFRVPRG